MRPILLALLTGISLHVAAQQYVPFPTANALWTVRHAVSEANVSLVCFGQQGGDTLLGGRVYHKLYQSPDTLFSATEFIGGLREDGAKRIYYLAVSASAETLLYDFNLTVGDTLKGIPATPSGAIVSSVDSVMIGTAYRRRLNIRSYAGSNGNPTFAAWIEGIGNARLGSLLSTATAQPTCDCGNNVLCFRQGSTWSYHNPNFTNTDCAAPILGLQEQIATTQQPVVVPNPVAGAPRIVLGPSHRYEQLRVYNAAGQLVQSTSVGLQPDVALNSTHWPAGLYFCRLTDDRGAAVTVRFLVP